MNESHNGDEIIVHPINDPIAPHYKFSIDPGFIFRDVSAGFGEVAQLLNPLLDMPSEGLGIAGGISFDEGHQRLKVVACDGGPDYASHPASSRMTSSCGITCLLSIAS